MCRYRYLFATILAVCFSGSSHADKAGTSRSAGADWYACEATADCAWSLGEGGWPTAVRGENAQAYRKWVDSQAPFTTYFMPGDCFNRDDEFVDYILRSKSAVTCVERLCKLDVEPECTK